ncbi:MAG TPA: hypothetical protein VLA32_09470 [Anaerolineales bacterium]|jgi:hypothetical protein|nr:hypothetical protein [Anaerolineales bacterium]
MVTSEERLIVLKMIEEGKVSVEDGANLLSSLEGSAPRRSPRPRPPAAPRDLRMLRVMVNEGRSRKLKVNVVLPMVLVDAGLNIASNYIDEDTEEHAAALIEAIRSGTTGKVLDYVAEDDGEHVQVFIE